MKSFVIFILSLLSFLFLDESAVLAQVNVIATQGTANASYSRLSQAFSYINNGTHKGNITINITGNTNETSAASLFYSGYNGTASYTSILIQPSGGAARTISGNLGGTPVIMLNGADNVTINGINSGGNSLTISNLSTAATSGTCTISFVNGATNNTITNCTVLGAFSGELNSTIIKGGTIYFSTDAVTAYGNDNNTISNCNIGPVGTNLPTVAIYGFGSISSIDIENSGNTISNNNIYDFFRPDIPSFGVYSYNGCNSWTITGNRFYQTAARTFTASAKSLHRVITIQPETHTAGAPATTITNNIIGFASPSQTGTYSLSGATGTFCGIYYYPAFAWAAADISNNTIASVSLTGVTSSDIGFNSPFAGIVINGSPANTNNNVIGSQSVTGSLLFSTNTASAVNIYGIFNTCTNTADYTANGNVIGGITVENPGSTSATFALCGIKQTSGSTNFTASSNIIGGTIVNSIQNNSVSTSAQIIGISHKQVNCTITSNTVRNITCAGGTLSTYRGSVIGILIYPGAASSTSHTVSGNLVHSLSNTNGTGTTNVYGVLCNAPSGTNTYTTMIEKNLIHSLSGASTTGEVNGICVLNTVSGASTTIANNMISLGQDQTGAAITNSIKFYGITDNSGKNYYYYNTVLLSGEGVTGSNPTYALFSNNNSTIRNFQNNILINLRSNAAGATGKHYAVSYSGLNFNLLTSDYNDLYASGAGGYIGYYGGDKANLSSWQSSTGKDSHSKSFNVSFALPTDLHLSGVSAANHDFDGIPITGITADFDGDIRNISIPYIGADELVAVPLPVELTSFSAAVNGMSIQLKWNTATEVSNYGFEIERMTADAGKVNWTKIGFVKGHGNSNSPVSYVFMDSHPLNGKNVYRLKQIDEDGKYEFSFTTDALICNVPGSFTLFNNYPNPANPSTTIKYGLPVNCMVTISIYSALGEKVCELVNEVKDAGFHEVNWNASGVSSGIYYYIMKAKEISGSRENIITRKMLILK